jgi:ABC-type multidrug transport system fused ATPase/permease subunit
MGLFVILDFSYMKTTDKYKINYPWKIFFADLLGFVGKNHTNLVAAVLLAISYEFVWLYFPVGIGEVVNFLTDYTPDQSFQPLTVIFVLLVLVSLWRAIGRRLANWLGYVVAARTANTAYHQGVQKLLQLGASWHASENSGNKVKRVQKGASSTERILRIFIKDLIPVIVAIPGAIIIIAQTDLVIAAGLALFAVIYFMGSRYVVTKGARYSHAVNQQEEHLSGLTFETINNIRVVQVGALSTSLLARIRGSLQQVLEFTQKRIFTFQILGMGPHVFANVSRLVLLGYVTYGVVNGHYELGLVMVVLGYFNAIWHATERVTDLASEFLVARYGVWRLRQILDADTYITDESSAQPFPKDWNTLTVNDLSFVY